MGTGEGTGVRSVISSSRGLASLPEGRFWSGLRCAVIESAADVRIVELATGEEKASLEAEWEGCLAGQVFGEGGELKWMRRSDGLHAVLISDRGESLTGRPPKDLARLNDDWTKAVDHAFLWGKRDGVLLYEDRIPREFVLSGPADAQRRQLRYPAGTPQPSEGRRLSVSLRWYELTVEVPEMTQQGVERRSRIVRISRWAEFTAKEASDVSAGAV